jgi:hypothetical protein
VSNSLNSGAAEAEQNSIIYISYAERKLLSLTGHRVTGFAGIVSDLLR